MRSSMTCNKSAGGCPRQSQRSLFYAFAILLIGIRPAIANGTTFPVDSVRKDMTELASVSTVIVRGTVISSEGYRQGGTGGIYTEIQIRVTDLIKGDLSDSVLIFDELGGTVGHDQLLISGRTGSFPRTLGDEAILLLAPKTGENGGSPRGLSLEVVGMVRIQAHMVFQGDKVIPPDSYVQYLRQLSSGSKISLDSFLQVLPESAPVPSTQGPGGSIPTSQTIAPGFDSTVIGTSGPGGQQQGEDSTSKLAPGPKSEGAEPAGPLSPPPHTASTTFLFDSPKQDEALTDKPLRLMPPEAAEASDWGTILGETFEGAFPGDNNWTLLGSPTWDDVSYSAHLGSWSGYCIGSTVSPPGPYPPNVNSWMVWGPFSLADAQDARVNFWYRNKSEQSYDWFYWTVSLTNAPDSYTGWGISGDQNSWGSESFDLKNVPTLGNICGQGLVWFAFVFQSDGSVGDIGTFVDDVVIEKYVPATAKIYQAWWTDEVDNDGDGYIQSARLTWDPDVEGSSGSLSVFEKIYYKLSTSGTWSLLTTTQPHTITGQVGDEIPYDVTGLSHGLYDWRNPKIS